MKMNEVVCQKGFTLVQMAVILVIVGLTVGSFFAALEVRDSRDRDQRTKDMQQVVASALTDYVQRIGRLPCPANPAETDVLKLGQARTNCLGAATQRVGVVPFATLGLAPSEILDGYGNPMTFAVQLDIARAPDLSTDVVYGSCRTPFTNGWMPIAGGANVNPVKAILCCRPVTNGNRLQVFASNGPAGAAVERIGAQVIPPDMSAQNVDMAIGGTGDTSVANASLDYIGYVLVSHGKDGQGAYILGTNGRRPTTEAGTGEIDNATDDQSFADFPRNADSGANHFDDIVLWRTQYRMMTDLRNDRCTRP